MAMVEVDETIEALRSELQGLRAELVAETDADLRAEVEQDIREAEEELKALGATA